MSTVLLFNLICSMLFWFYVLGAAMTSPPQVTLLALAEVAALLCQHRQGVLAASCMVQVTLPILQGSTQCWSRCFPGQKREHWVFPPSKRKRWEVVVLQFWRMQTPAQLLFLSLALLAGGYKCHETDFIYTVIARSLLGKCHLQ